ncbi:MAG: PHP domain-containing protein [Bryobacteraceae bacterium]
MIDLHAHTTASDGTYTPQQLVQEAREIGLDALSITDHDTFEGYDEACPLAERIGLPLVCGIELSTKLAQREGRAKSVHLLGYFLSGPAAEFREWIVSLQRARHERNVKLAMRLQSMGIDVTIEEVRAIGRSMAGRPHFARLLMEKGYVRTLQEAFDRYLDESAEAYVEKQDPSLEEGIRRIVSGGGIASLAHPVRLGASGDREAWLIGQIVAMGLPAIEIYHSDHTPDHVARYQALAERHTLAVTGGSDFHGDNKPGVRLGSGKSGNVRVPNTVLERLRMC